VREEWCIAIQRMTRVQAVATDVQNGNGHFSFTSCILEDNCRKAHTSDCTLSKERWERLDTLEETAK
jgi:hypothetical protein